MLQKVSYLTFDLFDLDFHNLIHERCKVVLSQVVNVVVPVADVALLFPWSQLARVHSPEVPHEHIVAQLMCEIRSAFVSTMDNPCLCIIQYTMLKVDDVQRSFVCHSMELDQVTILCFALVLLVFEATRSNKIVHGPSVHVLFQE